VPPANLVSWTRGDEYTYRVELSSSSKADSSPNSIAFKATAALRLHTQISGNATQFHAQLFDVDVQTVADSGAPFPQKLKEDLSAPWGFELASGAFHAIRARGGLSPFAFGILNTLAAGLQSPIDGGDGGVWDHEEADATGTYHARYSAGADRTELTRVKTAYEPRTLPGQKLFFGQMKESPSVIASQATLGLRGTDLFRLRSHDELEANVSAASKVHSMTDLSLTLVDHSPDRQAPDWAGLMGSTVSTPPGVLAVQPDVDPYDLTVAKDLTFPQALAAAEKENTPAKGSSVNPMQMAAADEATAGSRQRAFTELVALLRTRPGTVPLAVAAIDKGSSARFMLLDALGSASTPEAQAALVAYARRPKPADLREKAAGALIRTPRPVGASVDTLVDLLNDPALRSYAIMGLGTYARQLRERGSADLANRASGALFPLLDTKKASERVEILRGIANSGDARAFPLVRPLLDDPNEVVRAATIDAIRLMPNPEVDALVAGRMGPAQPLAVRLAAIDAARLRGAHEPLLSSVKAAAIASGDAESRLRAVMLLARWIPDAPDVRATLEQVASSDSREAVRHAAKMGLGT
jgi:HEAT repeat protein